MTETPSHILVADVGGTNSRVAFAIDGIVQNASIKRFKNADFPSLDAVLIEFLRHNSEVDISALCVAVAGMVLPDVTELTNLNWRITKDSLAKSVNVSSVSVINDLQAQGHALSDIPAKNLKSIMRGTTQSTDGAKLVVGIGTGFNAAPVHNSAQSTIVVPSECGHISLPVYSEQDLNMRDHLATGSGFASVEEVLSGRGLEQVYAWHAREDGSRKTSHQIMQDYARGDDKYARMTVETCVHILGRVCGDLALTHLPYQGIYLVGGVARALTPYLDTFGFNDQFTSKGRMSEFLKAFSVFVVEDDYAALTGCANTVGT